MPSSYDDAGKLILRVTIGFLILLHGIAKLSTGVGGIAGMLAAKGLPDFIAYGAYLGEIVAPVLIIVGVFTRPAAFVILGNMIIAVLLVHSDQIFMLTENGGWRLELQAAFLFGALAVMLLGAGRYSIGGVNARYN